MTKLEMVKAGAQIVVSIGVGIVVGNVVKVSSPAGRNVLKNICVGAAGLVLSDMVSDKACNHVETKIDDVANQLKEAVMEAANSEEEES